MNRSVNSTALAGNTLILAYQHTTGHQKNASGQRLPYLCAKPDVCQGKNEELKMAHSRFLLDFSLMPSLSLLPQV